MFQEITLINYRRPLAERAKSRKVCGPYRWRPAKVGTGRGFYQASKGLFMDPGGSSFDLRLEEANNILPSYSRTARSDGYYCDQFGDATLTPIVARLPKGRGFLAGWTMGAGMCASLDATIYADAESAAYAAHSIAENDAEREREYQAELDEDEAA